MTVLLAVLASPDGTLRFYALATAVILFVLGGYALALGFRTYREYRALAGTPIVPVGGSPTGMVHVRGKVAGGNPLTSPLTQAPCYFYRVLIERSVRINLKRVWQIARVEVAERPFYVDDGTGRVLVNAAQAEYEVTQTFRTTTGKARSRGHYLDPSLGAPEPSEEELHAYLSRASVGGAAPASTGSPAAQSTAKGLWGGHSYRFTEYCLLYDGDCNVIGSCAENSNPQTGQGGRIIAKADGKTPFLITSNTESEIEKKLRRRAWSSNVQGAFALLLGGFLLWLIYKGIL